VLGIRDLLELPLVVWLALEPAALEDRRGDVKANRLGKATTVLQFAAIAAALLAPPLVGVLALTAGGVGLVAGLSYWSRALRHVRTARS
jgi:phosphatidylglycerophosphate synthase